MTPLLACLARGRQIVQCLVGLHEYVTHRQEAQGATKDAPAQPGLIQQRCLHCGRLTDGWIAEGPRYYYREGMREPRANILLHNGRLDLCLCCGCREARLQAAQQAKRGKVTTIRRSA